MANHPSRSRRTVPVMLAAAVKGATSMPNFHLSDAEIEAIVAYLTALDGGGNDLRR